MTTFVLKLIALTTMIIDHTGAALRPLYDTTIMRYIGRISFPLYAFFIAEGCRKTSNIKRYMFRLFIFALISEIPYDLLFCNIHSGYMQPFVFLDFTRQNVFFTLFLGVLAIFVYQTAQKKRDPVVTWLGLFSVAVILYSAEFLRTDYGAYGTILIFMLYVAKKRSQQAFAMIAGILLIYHDRLTATSYPFLIFALISVVLILLYNGKQGPRLKWLFYAIYPLHLLILAGIYHFVMS